MGRFLRDPAQFQQFRGMLQDLQKTIADARNGDFMQSDESYSGWSNAVIVSRATGGRNQCTAGC